MLGERGSGLVEIRWVANPFRADKFEQAWLPVAETALDYGARSWAFVRSLERTDRRLVPAVAEGSETQLDGEVVGRGLVALGELVALTVHPRA